MSNTGHLLDSKTLALWRLDDGQGLVASDAVGSFPLTPTGGNPAQTTKLIFDSGYAKRFNGPYFTGAGSLALTTALLGEFTAEAAISPDTLGTDTRMMEITSATERLMGFVLDTSGHVQAYWLNGVTFEIQTSTQILVATKSYHVAMRKVKVQGGYRIDLFINGVKDSSSGVLPNSTGSGASTIFLGRGAGANPFTGVIDDFRISSIARTDAEIYDSWNRCFNNATLSITAQPPYSHVANRTMWMSLIRPIRDADMDQGRLLLQRFLARQEYNADLTATRIRSLTNMESFSKVSDAQVKYLKDHVGLTKELDKITSKLSVATLRKFGKGAIALWKRRGTPQSLTDLLRILTTRTPVIRDWFYYRAILGESSLADEQVGLDYYINGGGASTNDEFYSNVRIMDPGPADPVISQLILDSVNLCRPLNDRDEIILLDFLDAFDDGSRSRWTNIVPGTGGAATVDATNKNMTFTPGCEEEAKITIVAAASLTNILASHKFKFLNVANMHQVKIFVAANTAHYRIDVNKTTVVLNRVTSVGGVTALVTYTLPVPLVANVEYGFRVQCTPSAGSNVIRIYLDGTLVIDTVDASPTSTGGAYRILNPGASPGNNVIDNVELSRLPARSATVGPSGYTYSSNFLSG